jgi:hypothetical protein
MKSSFCVYTCALYKRAFQRLTSQAVTKQYGSYATWRPTKRRTLKFPINHNNAKLWRGQY